MFKDKKILFFSASFFGYQLEICKNLTALGAKVDFFDERPKNDFWTKAMIRIDKRIMKQKIQKYYQNIINGTSEVKYDYVFFIKAEVITLEMLQQLRQKQPKAQFILYMWDSIKNNPAVVDLLPVFNKILSFDRKDVEDNATFHFRPLFYLDEYSAINPIGDRKKYDITFIGTGHTDRYQFISKVRKFCDNNKLKGFFFMYLQDWRIFIVRKLFQKGFRNANHKDFSFNPMNKSQLIKIMEQSNCVLDIERSVQCGLTMRTMEVLGARRKLLTTNREIVYYDFYNENNIKVVDRQNPVLSLDFIKSGYQDIDEAVYKKYSINNWLYEIFE